MALLKKIVIIGPESTGKSTLCRQLAQHYQTAWVPEFARDYLEKNGMDYTYESLVAIAKGQVALEEEYILSQIDNRDLIIDNAAAQFSIHNSPFSFSNSLLFIDTDMYVMKIWSEFVFNKCNNWILNQIASRKYDLYLLCNVDLAWVKDNLREYPDLITRNRLYNYYKDSMINQATPWTDISGDYQQRFSKAVYAINSVIS